MSAWAAKRFWKQATAEACDGGFCGKLDGRAVKTPAKRPLVVPTLAMAQAIAAEWDAQEGPVSYTHLDVYKRQAIDIFPATHR